MALTIDKSKLSSLRRGIPLSLVLLLAACGSTDDEAVEGREPIACLLPGQSGFKTVCTIEHMNTPDGMVLTARAPDGGFHRFLVVGDGRGVIAADGAEPVAVKAAPDGHIDVAADDSTYRLSARVTP